MDSPEQISLEALFSELKANFQNAPLLNGEETWSERQAARDVGRYADSLRLIQKHTLSGATCLDLGAFPGCMSYLLKAHLGCQVTSYCYSVSDTFKTFMENLGLLVAEGDLTQDSLPEIQPDLVVFAEVIEHLLNPLGVLQKIAAIMKPGSLLFLSTPNQAHLRARFDFLLQGKTVYEYPAHIDITAPGPKGHVRLYTVEELSELLAKAGFEILEVNGSAWELHTKFGGKRKGNWLKRLIPSSLQRGILLVAQRR